MAKFQVTFETLNLSESDVGMLRSFGCSDIDIMVADYAYRAIEYKRYIMRVGELFVSFTLSAEEARELLGDKQFFGALSWAVRYKKDSTAGNPGDFVLFDVSNCYFHQKEQGFSVEKRFKSLQKEDSSEKSSALDMLKVCARVCPETRTEYYRFFTILDSVPSLGERLCGKIVRIICPLTPRIKDSGAARYDLYCVSTYLPVKGSAEEDDEVWAGDYYVAVKKKLEKGV